MHPEIDRRDADGNPVIGAGESGADARRRQFREGREGEVGFDQAGLFGGRLGNGLGHGKPGLEEGGLGVGRLGIGLGGRRRGRRGVVEREAGQTDEQRAYV